ncbi:MAG: hypothetical protein R6V33_03785 [Pelovirga sp.]
MLVIMKKRSTEAEIEQVKEFLVNQDCDFHQSTGVDRIILGVVGDTRRIDRERLKKLNGVLDIYKIPDEE